MNIIFLDIDGVLLTYRMHNMRQQIQYGYDPNILSIFLDVVEEAPIPTKIVLISSTLKNTDPFRWITDKGLRSRFTSALYPITFAIDKYFISTNRPAGIKEWIEQYGQDANRYILIEDDLSEYTHSEIEIPNMYLVPCKNLYGLQWPEMTLLSYLLQPQLDEQEIRFIDNYLDRTFHYSDIEQLKKYWAKTMVFE